MEGWIKLFGGLALIVYGMWSLLSIIKETKKGYRSKYGGDIKLYFSAVVAILLGIVLIYREIF